MKKILIIITVIFVLLALAACVFVFTFDANRYKGALIAKLEESMDRDVRIDNLSLRFLGGLVIEAKGVEIKDKDKAWGNFLLKAKTLNASVKILPLLKKDIQIERLSVPELEINTGTGPDSPVFRCGLDLNIRILINSLPQGDVLKTLTAKGNMKLGNAVLDKMNVLTAAFDKLSILPELTQKLKDKLPEKYSALLKQNYTAFKPMRADFEIKQGRIIFDKFVMESDAFYIESKGSIGIQDQSLDIGADLYIPKDLSDAFVGAVPELEYITDDKGLIAIPLEIRGMIPEIKMKPNLNYVLKRLFSSKGQKLLNRLFKGK